MSKKPKQVLREYRIAAKDWIKEKCIRMKISQDQKKSSFVVVGLVIVVTIP